QGITVGRVLGHARVHGAGRVEAVGHVAAEVENHGHVLAAKTRPAHHAALRVERLFAFERLARNARAVVEHDFAEVCRGQTDAASFAHAVGFLQTTLPVQCVAADRAFGGGETVTHERGARLERVGA